MKSGFAGGDVSVLFGLRPAGHSIGQKIDNFWDNFREKLIVNRPKILDEQTIQQVAYQVDQRRRDLGLPKATASITPSLAT